MKRMTGVFSHRGVTLMEVVIVVAILTVIVLIVSTHLQRKRELARRSHCVCNMKKIGLSFQIFANENEGRFPQTITVQSGGAMEAAVGGDVFQIFQVMSNELSVPSQVICASDNRDPASSFSELANSNVSYFVGVDVMTNKPGMLLAGDRNLAIDNQLLTGSVALKTNQSIHWSRSIHRESGNYVLVDGSVTRATKGILLDQLKVSGDSDNLVLFPQ